uniref:Phosphoglycerate mutase-like protein 1 isoform X2 n=1 Tax=Rhizophora mucronata TaxID=61149 RepID=A0A2P2MJF9_RHIMU
MAISKVLSNSISKYSLVLQKLISFRPANFSGLITHSLNAQFLIQFLNPKSTNYSCSLAQESPHEYHLQPRKEKHNAWPSTSLYTMTINRGYQASKKTSRL